jgi:hypothetical protein
VAADLLVFIRMLIFKQQIFLVPQWNWLLGIGMDLYKTQFLDGCPDGSGKKLEMYKPMSQIIWAHV